MKTILACVGVLLLASVVQAQTHPCDVTVVPNIKINKSTATVGFCHNQKDKDGNTEPAGALTFQPSLDGTRVGVYVTVTPQTGPSASGMYYFEFATPVTVSKASHVVTVWAKDPDGEVESLSYPFVVGGPGPSAASALRVK